MGEIFFFGRRELSENGTMLAGRGTTLVRYEQEERVCQSVLVLGESLLASCGGLCFSFPSGHWGSGQHSRRDHLTLAAPQSSSVCCPKSFFSSLSHCVSTPGCLGTDYK